MESGGCRTKAKNRRRKAKAATESCGGKRGGADREVAVTKSQKSALVVIRQKRLGGRGEAQWRKREEAPMKRKR